MSKNLSIQSIIFALSFFLIFVCFEGSFTLLSLFPVIIYSAGVFILRHNISFRLSKNDKLFILLIVILIFSTIINSFIYPKLITVKSAIEVFYFLGIFIWFSINTKEIHSKEEINLVVKSYIVSSLLACLFIIFSFISGSEGKLPLINILGVAIDPNFISAFISVACIYLFIIILLSKKIKISDIVSLIILIFSIFLIGSRAALVGLICSMLLALLINLFIGFNKRKICLTFGIVTFSIVMGVMVINLIPKWNINRYFNINNYFDNSNSERINIWENSINGIKKQPLIGYGIGVFNNIEEFKYVEFGNEIRNIPESSPGHNTYLDIAIYFGLIGLSIFLIFLCNIFSKCFYKHNILLISIIFTLLFLTNVIGADKSVFLWNNLIIIKLITDYNKKNNTSLENIFN